MSAQPDLVRAAAKVLADASARATPPTPSPEARSEAIAAMQLALRARSSKRRRRVWGARLAIAAGFVVAALAGRRLVSKSVDVHAAMTARWTQDIVASGRVLDGAATTWHEGRPADLAGALSSGDRVVTGAGAHAEIALSTGTSVVLEPQADVTYTHVAREQTFTVTSGGVNARVAKLHEGDRFVVRTSDVEVEVRGTVFEVSLAASDSSCGGGTRTRVSVTEGVVVVRNRGVETRVSAGERWPTGCAAVAVATPENTAPPAIATTASATAGGAPAPSVVAVNDAKPAASTSSTGPRLEVKDDVFAAAMSARRRGDLRTALSGFEAYLVQFPGGELAENATVQRMRILARLDSVRATEAAHDYLARYPHGFARDEAEALAAPKEASAQDTP
jgi:hypothetical protein